MKNEDLLQSIKLNVVLSLFINLNLNYTKHKYLLTNCQTVQNIKLNELIKVN